ncbi:MAG: hypothetical protein PVG30_05440 [Gammaproteobacteria bacterium]|jgi:hypothetical protein
MKRKIVIALLIIVLAIAVGSFYFYKTSRPLHSAVIKPKIILFYGLGCPHCAKVEAFLRTPQAKNISIITKEVYYDRTNLRNLISKAQKCGAVKDGTVAIPLLWQGNNQCIIGEDKVMQYLKNLVKKQ